MFVDEAEIITRSGKGGAGAVSFRREKFVPRGGPDGGDGGDGGSVYIRADASKDTLLDLVGRHHWIAENGRPGMGKNCHGRKGRSVYVDVPPGTIVRDKETGFVLRDLVKAGDMVCVVEGGKGGRGNRTFASPTNQTPRRAEQGLPGQERMLHLELKLIADVGLVGLPNAGKSTLLSRVSAARPKVADYPFTTLHPVLGIADLRGHRRLVLADVPGLIEGAHEGTGLGDAFLRHIERTRTLVHVVDICPLEGDPVEHYRVIRNELEKHSPTLAGKAEIVVANKTDLTGSDEALARLRDELGCEVLGISAATNKGLDRMLERVWQMVQDNRDEQEQA